MRISIKTIVFFGSLLMILQFIILYLNLHSLYFITPLSMITFLFLPGYFILLLLRATRQLSGVTLVYSVGLSVFLLELIGLVINLVLSYLHIPQPLSLYPLIIGIGSTMLTLSLLILIFNSEEYFQISLPNLNLLETFLIPIITVLPVIAAFGAISINNYSTNLITIYLLGIIGLLIVVLTLLRNRINSFIYPYSIFFIALSLLFTTSLRSWFVSGHDILREYYVYTIALSNLQWDVSLYRDAYNACLSITILPVMLEQLLGISGTYIFKIVFQIIFAFCPVLLFYIFKKYLSSILSFLAVFLFMSFPTFYNDMPMLTRQEIAFLMFGIALHTLLSSTLSSTRRKVLFIIFTVGIIFSHYSTNYILIILTASVYIFSLMSKHKFTKKLLGKIPRARSQFIHIPFLSIELIIIMIAFTYIWNFQITKTGSNLSKTLKYTFDNLLNRSFNDSRSSDVSYSLLFPRKLDPKEELNEYIEENIKKAKERKETDFYNMDDYKDYIIKPEKQTLLKRTEVGEALHSLNIPVFRLQSLFRSISAGMMQILVVIGIVILYFKNHKKQIDTQFIYLCITGIGLLLLTIILPGISAEYGLLRMFQQMLFVFSFPIILAIYSATFFVGDYFRHILTSITVVAFFLTLSGFFSHITGDYYPQMTLDNAGLYYDAYYVEESDVLSAEWLAGVYNKKSYIQSDLSGAAKLVAFGKLFAEPEIFPQIIRKDAYVYFIGNPRAIVTIDKNVLIFSSPELFVQNNKNLLYNNGQGRIYK